MTNLYFGCFLCIILSSVVVTRGAVPSIQCLDEEGQPVDWFIAYKLSDSSKYYYMDVRSPTWRLSDNEMNSSDGHAVAHTLQQIYDNLRSEDSMYFLYSDQYPSQPTTCESDDKKTASSTWAHSKGFSAFDTKTGFWMIHSLPNFPTNESYCYPDSGLAKAQTFLCVSLAYDVLDTFGRQLKQNRPKIYAHRYPTAFAEDEKNGHMNDLMKDPDENWKLDVDRRVVEMTSLGGISFTNFAKSGKPENGLDLYKDLVAPTFQCNLHVQSWKGTSSPMDSLCEDGIFTVENVKSIKFGELEIDSYKREDHSKWTITEEVTCADSWVCVGDINREESQRKRGGGTMCFKQPVVHSQFNTIVTDLEDCDEQIEDNDEVKFDPDTDDIHLMRANHDEF